MTAFDKDAARRWQRISKPAGAGGGLAGDALEKAIMSIAMVHPDIVEVTGRG